MIPVLINLGIWDFRRIQLFLYLISLPFYRITCSVSIAVMKLIRVYGLKPRMRSANMMYIAWEALLEEQVITFLFTCAFDWIWGQRFRQQKRSEKRTEVASC